MNRMPGPSRNPIRPVLVALAVASIALAGAVLLAPPAAAKACDGVSTPCEIGDTGPGGGIVFYDAGSTKAWGRYLEAAPAGWLGGSQDPTRVWCPTSARGYDRYLRTGTAIGTGALNTRRIIAMCGRQTAAGLAASHDGGGRSDWFLPSRGELKVLHAQRDAVGGFSDESNVWSSSQYRDKGRNTTSVAWGRSFIPSGGEGGAGKQSDGWVRPIRAF